MKKFIMFIMVFILVCFLCSCGSNDGNASVNAQEESTGISSDTPEESTGTSADIPEEDANTSSETQEDTASTGSGLTNLAQDGDMIEITEKMFVTYINEVYTNTDDYIGKTIKIEGMYTAEEYETNIYHYVYRSGPGCCGSDGSMCGFEFTYDGEMPEDNDWIEVVGTLRTYEENGNTYLSLEAQSVTVMDTRGAEIVSQ